jgi:hypothetical protein
MFDQQARAMTGCMKMTLITPLIVEAYIIPATVFLDNKQQQYIERLVDLLEKH